LWTPGQLCSCINLDSLSKIYGSSGQASEMGMEACPGPPNVP